MRRMKKIIKVSKLNKSNLKLRIQLKNLNNKYRMFSKYNSKILRIRKRHKERKELKLWIKSKV